MDWRENILPWQNEFPNIAMFGYISIMRIEEFMNNFRDCIRKEMYSNDYTITEISTKCELSYDGFCKIYYGKSKDVNVSTILKVCSNTSIEFEDLFLNGFETDIAKALSGCKIIGKDGNIYKIEVKKH